MALGLPVSQSAIRRKPFADGHVMTTSAEHAIDMVEVVVEEAATTPDQGRRWNVDGFMPKRSRKARANAEAEPNPQVTE